MDERLSRGSSPTPGARVRLLLAENEPALREVFAEGLRGEGFDVEEAVDGGEALALFHARGPFDALVLDEEMPRLRGREVLARLRAAGSGVAAVICSGSLSMDGQERSRLGVAALLRKPFPLEALVEALREALAAPAEP